MNQRKKDVPSNPNSGTSVALIRRRIYTLPKTIKKKKNSIPWNNKKLLFQDKKKKFAVANSQRREKTPIYIKISKHRWPERQGISIKRNPISKRRSSSGERRREKRKKRKKEEEKRKKSKKREREEEIPEEGTNKRTSEARG